MSTHYSTSRSAPAAPRRSSTLRRQESPATTSFGQIWGLGSPSMASPQHRSSKTCVRTSRSSIRTTLGGVHVVLAEAVVVATGPQRKWKVPEPFKPFVATPSVVHTPELFETGATLSEAIVTRTQHLAPEARVLGIGGGLTSVQAALAAVRAGLRVSLRSREELRTREYDV
eukprot:1956747-Rhodomonas_salina.1